MDNNVKLNFLMCLLIMFGVIMVLFSSVSSNEFNTDGEYSFLQIFYLFHPQLMSGMFFCSNREIRSIISVSAKHYL